MNNEKPTYEELEALLRKDAAWTWKRFLAAVGFGLVIPVLLFALTRPGRDKQANAPTSRIAIEQAEMATIKQMEMEQRILSDRELPSEPKPATEPTLGLLAISVFGLGLLAFRTRGENAGRGASAALCIIGSIVLGGYAYERGSFVAFESLLALRPAEFLSQPMARTLLLLFAAAAVVLAALEFPELLNSCFRLIQGIGRAIGRAISGLCKGYASVCWFLAKKVIPAR